MRAVVSQATQFLALSWILLGLLTSVLSLAVFSLALPRPWAVLGLAAHLASLLLPLRVARPAWARRLLCHLTSASVDYFPITVEFEDKDSFKTDRPFVVGYEPHSVFPIGACMFLPHAPGMPRCLTNSHMAATSSVFLVPFMRHLLYWAGCRPASREVDQLRKAVVLRQSLAGGTTVVVCPGGVQECFYMEPGGDREVAFLRQRTGFVRLAMQEGAPLVPVFAFGQTPHYSFWRPFIDRPTRVLPQETMSSFVRRIGFVPLVAWGVLGTPMPRKVPMHIVVGSPIEVPHLSDPSPAEVEAHLQQYIAALQSMFERRKAAAGHPRARLTVM